MNEQIVFSLRCPDKTSKENLRKLIKYLSGKKDKTAYKLILELMQKEVDIQ